MNHYFNAFIDRLRDVALGQRGAGAHVSADTIDEAIGMLLQPQTKRILQEVNEQYTAGYNNAARHVVDMLDGKLDSAAFSHPEMAEIQVRLAILRSRLPTNIQGEKQAAQLAVHREERREEMSGIPAVMKSAPPAAWDEWAMERSIAFTEEWSGRMPVAQFQNAVHCALIEAMQHVEPTTWLPMETAPRDGTWILTYCPDRSISDFPTVAFWDDGCGWWAVSSDVAVKLRPTHWMPIPQAPAPSET